MLPSPVPPSQPACSALPATASLILDGRNRSRSIPRRGRESAGNSACALRSFRDSGRGTRNSSSSRRTFGWGSPWRSPGGNWSARAELCHLSSHRGADFAAVNPAANFSYSREAVQTLIAYGRPDRWRIYAGPSVTLRPRPWVDRMSFQAGSGFQNPWPNPERASIWQRTSRRGRKSAGD